MRKWECDTTLSFLCFYLENKSLFYQLKKLSLWKAINKDIVYERSLDLNDSIVLVVFWPLSTLTRVGRRNLKGITLKPTDTLKRTKALGIYTNTESIVFNSMMKKQKKKKTKILLKLKTDRNKKENVWKLHSKYEFHDRFSS